MAYKAHTELGSCIRCCCLYSLPGMSVFALISKLVTVKSRLIPGLLCELSSNRTPTSVFLSYPDYISLVCISVFLTRAMFSQRAKILLYFYSLKGTHWSSLPYPPPHAEITVRNVISSDPLLLATAHWTTSGQLAHVLH